MKMKLITLSIAAMFGSGSALASFPCSAPVPTVTTTGNNFTMVSAANGLTGGTNDVTFTWDHTYRTSVVTDGTCNATISSPTPFSAKKWTAHHVNIYTQGTYTFYTGCPSGGITSATYNPSCGTGTAYTLTVGAGQLGAHMLFNWSNSSDIDVVLLWNMNNSWAGTGTASAFQAGGSNTVNTVWDAVSIDTTIDGDAFSGTQMIDGPFVGQSANFNVNGKSPGTSLMTPNAPNLDSTTPVQPAHDASGTAKVSASATTNYVVTFDRPMSTVSPSMNTGFLSFSPPGVVSVNSVVADTSKKVFTFGITGLKSDTHYTVTLNANNAATADDTNMSLPFASQPTKEFWTSPVTFTTSPAQGDIAGLTGAGALTYQVTFSEPMNPASVVAGFLSFAPAPVVAVGAPVASAGNTVFAFPMTLNSTTPYTVTFNAGPVDTNGAGTAVTLTPASMTFTSGVADTTSPTVVAGSRLPAPSSTETSLIPTFSVTFSEPMGASTAAAIHATKVVGGAVACTPFVSVDAMTFTCTPSSPLTYGAQYSVSVTGDAARTPVNASAAQDSVGNNLITYANNTWTFTMRDQTGSVANPVVLGSLSASTSDGDLTTLTSTATASPTNRNVTYDPDFVRYIITNVPTGTSTVLVRLTFPSSLTGKILYKTNTGGTTFSEIREITGVETINAGEGCVFKRRTDIDDRTIDVTIRANGTCDTNSDPTIIDDPVVPATPIVATLGEFSAAGGGGGGCTVDPSGKDVSLLVALLASLGYVGWRRRRS